MLTPAEPAAAADAAAAAAADAAADAAVAAAAAAVAGWDVLGAGGLGCAEVQPRDGAATG